MLSASFDLPRPGNLTDLAVRISALASNVSSLYEHSTQTRHERLLRFGRIPYAVVQSEKERNTWQKTKSCACNAAPISEAVNAAGENHPRAPRIKGSFLGSE